MFYEIEDIDKLLVCENCSCHYCIPKLLPCGSTICEECEDNIWSEIKKDIKCPFCNHFHQKPLNGYPVNLLIQKLVKTKPHCAYDEVLYKKSIEVFDSIEDQLGKLKIFLRLEKIEDKIHQHCQNLLKSIDNKIKERKAQLNEFRIQFEEQIDEYERKCMENIKNEPKDVEQEMNEDIEKLVYEADSKLVLFRNNFKRLDLDENDLRAILAEAHELNNELISSHHVHEYFAFSGAPLLFQKSNQELLKEHVGELYESKTTNLNSERINSTTAISFNFKNGSIICKSSITPVNTDKLALLFLMYTSDAASDLFSYQIRLRLYHRTSMKLLHETSELHSTQSFTCLSVASLNSEIYIVFEDQNNDFWLRNYDIELNLIDAVQLHFQAVSVHASLNRINIVAAQSPLIRVYDKKLNLLTAFGQNDDPHEPYFIKNNQKIQFQRELIFVDDDDYNVYIILRDSGFLIKKIQTNQSKCLFQVDASLRIILMDPASKIFFIYDLNGDLVDQFEIKVIKNITGFSVTKDGTLTVIDNENGTVNIY